jgi:sulfopyruvate decarboxylase TPP-binding subunit
LFTGSQIAGLLRSLGTTHVVTIPDSTIGQWDEAIGAAPDISVVRACREGETWEIAAGLHLGGAVPMVLIQCTGLFESGDSLRNVVHDWRLPIQAIIGYRSYLNQDTLPGDTCLTFTEPVLDAWKMPYLLVTRPEQLESIGQHHMRCRGEGKAGVTLLAEGKA